MTNKRRFLGGHIAFTCRTNVRHGRHGPERGNADANNRKVGGPSRNRTGVHGFAIRYVTTPPSGHPAVRDASDTMMRLRQWGIAYVEAGLRCDDGRAAINRKQGKS